MTVAKSLTALLNPIAAMRCSAITGYTAPPIARILVIVFYVMFRNES